MTPIRNMALRETAKFRVFHIAKLDFCVKNIKSAWLSYWSKGGSQKDVKLELPAQCLGMH